LRAKTRKGAPKNFITCLFPWETRFVQERQPPSIEMQFFVAHFLQIIRRQGRAEAASAIENQRCRLVRTVVSMSRSITPLPRWMAPGKWPRSIRYLRERPECEFFS